MTRKRKILAHALLGLLWALMPTFGCDSATGHRVNSDDQSIVNGSTADEDQFQAVIAFAASGQGSFCSGAIVGPRHILTAAHCVAERTNGLYTGQVKPFFTAGNTVRYYAGREDVEQITQDEMRSFVVESISILPGWLTHNSGQDDGFTFNNAGPQDLALITASPSTTWPPERWAVLDFRALAAGTELVFTGYGHHQSANPNVADSSFGFRYRRDQHLTPDQVIQALADQGQDFEYRRTFLTAAEPFTIFSVDPSSSIAPGDSGGPVFLWRESELQNELFGPFVSEPGKAQLRIVGVNQGVTWSSQTDVALQSYSSRIRGLTEDNQRAVHSWLSEHLPAWSIAENEAHFVPLVENVSQGGFNRGEMVNGQYVIKACVGDTVNLKLKILPQLNLFKNSGTADIYSVVRLAVPGQQPTYYSLFSDTSGELQIEELDALKPLARSVKLEANTTVTVLDNLLLDEGFADADLTFYNGYLASGHPDTDLQHNVDYPAQLHVERCQ